MTPSTLLSTLEHPELEQPAHRTPVAPAQLLIAAIAATAALLVGLADWAAPTPFVAASVRALVIAIALGAWANWFGKRAEQHFDARFDTLETKVEARLRRACCAEAFVDGLARRPWDEEKYRN